MDKVKALSFYREFSTFFRLEKKKVIKSRNVLEKKYITVKGRFVERYGLVRHFVCV